MSGTALYVVDMQPGFPAYQEAMSEVLHEIRLAKRRGDGIYFVELDAHFNGKTHEKLVRTARSGGYDKVFFTSKLIADGSYQFIEAARQSKLPYRAVRVCGVNRGDCVLFTCIGLCENLDPKVKVELALAATAPGSKVWHDYAAASYNSVTDYKQLIKQGRFRVIR